MTIPPIVTDVSEVITAAGVATLWLRMGDLRRELRDVWREIGRLRGLHMNRGRGEREAGGDGDG